MKSAILATLLALSCFGVLFVVASLRQPVAANIESHGGIERVYPTARPTLEATRTADEINEYYIGELNEWSKERPDSGDDVLARILLVAVPVLFIATIISMAAKQKGLTLLFGLLLFASIAVLVVMFTGVCVLDALGLFWLVE